MNEFYFTFYIQQLFYINDIYPEVFFLGIVIIIIVQILKIYLIGDINGQMNTF